MSNENQNENKIETINETNTGSTGTTGTETSNTGSTSTTESSATSQSSTTTIEYKTAEIDYEKLAAMVASKIQATTVIPPISIGNETETKQDYLSYYKNKKF